MRGRFSSINFAPVLSAVLGILGIVWALFLTGGVVAGLLLGGMAIFMAIWSRVNDGPAVGSTIGLITGGICAALFVVMRLMLATGVVAAA